MSDNDVNLGNFFDSVPSEQKSTEDNSYSYDSVDAPVTSSREDLSEISGDLSMNQRGFLSQRRTRSRSVHSRNLMLWPRRVLIIAIAVIIVAFLYEALFVLRIR